MTLREISEALGFSGTTIQFDALRFVLEKFQELGYIYDESGLIDEWVKPNDLLRLRFMKSVFNESEGSFVRAFDDDLKKLFDAKKLITLERNSLVYVICLWFLLSCRIYPGHPAPYSHKLLRRQLRRSDKTIKATPHNRGETSLSGKSCQDPPLLSRYEDPNQAARDRKSTRLNSSH